MVGRKQPPRVGSDPAPGRLLALFFLLLGVLASWSCTGRSHLEPGRPSWRERGWASWYGPGFHGKPTASGERYDMYQFTCAHRTLPFGTWLEVRRLDNGRRVQVRVNDRGPFVSGRIVDLSWSAAQALELLVVGTAPVEIRAVGFESPKGTAFAVQVGAFQEAQNAQRLAKQLAAAGISARVESDEIWHRVRVGSFSRRAEAERLASELASRGYRVAIVALR